MRPDLGIPPLVLGPQGSTLASLRGPDGAPAEGTPDKIAELAREFEAIFLNQLLQQMRRSMAWDDGAEEKGFGLDAMNQTVDAALAQQLSRQGGIGLAAVFARQLGAHATSAGASVTALAAPVVDVAPEAVSEAPGPAPAAALPSIGPQTSSFGWRRDPFDGQLTFHRGVDIAAAYGTEVPAAAGGRVALAESSPSYGNTVVVEHASGARLRYAHLSSILVQPGETVRQGQVLGRVGSTGRATGPHLHFELLIEGERVDPGTWLARIQDTGSRADYEDGSLSTAARLPVGGKGY